LSWRANPFGSRIGAVGVLEPVIDLWGENAGVLSLFQLTGRKNRRFAAKNPDKPRKFAIKVNNRL
jgi:hypothetical protein